MTRRPFVAALVALAVLIPAGAFGHAERPTQSPPRPGSVPNQSRTPAATLDVCKTGACPNAHIQAAVDAVTQDGTLIRVWPGVYKEEPSRAAPELTPDMNGVFSYGFQYANPNSENLIAIIGETPDVNGSPSGTSTGKKNLTLRGMGDDPRDVVIDVEFSKHVGIRGDNADGLIIENLSVWHAYDHGVYILDTDGFVIDGVASGYSREYPFLTFANDHGLMKNCEAFGGGDGGLYPGGAADTPGRHSMEIANCKSYHNVLGYSGSQGDHVWIHDTEFSGNGVGLVSDSETDHPNYPQNNVVFERNTVYGNNFNPYESTSDVKATVFADDILIPIGVGVLLASGNENLVQNNRIWGHERFGAWLLNGVGVVLGPTGDPPAAPFLSSGNRFIGNRMYGPGGEQNAVDFGWDGLGYDDCWEGNTRTPQGAAATGDALLLPPCSTPEVQGPAEVPEGPMPLTAGVPNAPNLLMQAGLVFVDGPDGNKPLCISLALDPCSWGPGPAAGNARNLPASEGGTTDRSYVPTPSSCGPSSPSSCWT